MKKIIGYVLGAVCFGLNKTARKISNLSFRIRHGKTSKVIQEYFRE